MVLMNKKSVLGQAVMSIFKVRNFYTTSKSVIVQMLFF